MTNIKRSWDILSDEQRKSAIDEIIHFFSSERGEEIGVIAAGNLLDLFLQTSGLELYNQGVEDSKKFIKNRMAEIEVDLDVSLKKLK